MINIFSEDLLSHFDTTLLYWSFCSPDPVWRDNLCLSCPPVYSVQQIVHQNDVSNTSELYLFLKIFSITLTLSCQSYLDILDCCHNSKQQTETSHIRQSTSYLSLIRFLSLSLSLSLRQELSKIVQVHCSNKTIVGCIADTQGWPALHVLQGGRETTNTIFTIFISKHPTRENSDLISTLINIKILKIRATADFKHHF